MGRARAACSVNVSFFFSFSEREGGKGVVFLIRILIL